MDLAAPRPSSAVAFVLLACGVVLVLAWMRAVVFPLVVTGKLPSGHNLAAVLARRGRQQHDPGDDD
jgi:hypothetical protein